jgi:hypothetical protein
MKCKINIIEPWESGTDRATAGDIVKRTGTLFLIFIEKLIKLRGAEAHYFICKLQDENSASRFNKGESGIYKITRVFDKNVS